MSHADILDTDIHTFLERHEQKDLLRFVAVGSVDDGKSTLIGRLLVDTDAVYDDHLADATERGGTGVLDLARITDGLRAEREQGITIDVAYRYFTTAQRKFIIADTPGHIQYTRNMATGASTADLAIILIDARLGVLQQSRRHAFIASMLGIPYLVVAVNKMDLVDFDEGVYNAICDEFRAFTAQLRYTDVRFLPISALMGDNVVHRSESTPWYTGGSMLDILQTVDVMASRNLDVFRFPVQYVVRPHLDYRGFAAQIVSGVVKKGDPIVVLPSGTTSHVRSIDTYDGELDEAFAPQSVVLRLTDEVDVSRGDVLAHTARPPQVAHSFDAMFVWMSETPLDTGKSYLIKHGARYITGWLEEVRYEVDLDTLAEKTDVQTLGLNAIGRVAVRASRPLVFDPYDENRAMGALIVIDSMTNNTVGAGMICRADGRETAADAARAELPRSGVSVGERTRRFGHAGAVLWCEGGDGDASAALAFALERRLFDRGCAVHVVERAHDGATLAAVAGQLVDAGLLAVCVAPSSAPVAELALSALAAESVHRVAAGAGASADAVRAPAGATPEQAAAAIIGELESKGLRLGA
ncbi:MAG: sulfate adenylyltransferase subunit CysN [Myxococcota bacterium]